MGQRSKGPQTKTDTTIVGCACYYYRIQQLPNRVLEYSRFTSNRKIHCQSQTQYDNDNNSDSHDMMMIMMMIIVASCQV